MGDINICIKVHFPCFHLGNNMHLQLFTCRSLNCFTLSKTYTWSVALYFPNENKKRVLQSTKENNKKINCKTNSVTESMHSSYLQTSSHTICSQHYMHTDSTGRGTYQNNIVSRILMIFITIWRKNGNECRLFISGLKRLRRQWFTSIYGIC